MDSFRCFQYLSQNCCMKKIESDIEKQIINDYVSGLTNNIISKKYLLHRTTIQRILLRNNIALRKQAHTSRKHIILDENFFKDIDSEEKSYMLGTLYADGYINSNGFGITLKEDDKEILEQLSTIIYGNVVLGYKPSRICSQNIKYISKPQYRLEIVSKKMKCDLIKHGCVQKKSFLIKFPNFIDINQYKHFIRGYFDGDGCLTIPQKRPNNITLTITSNTNFCNGLVFYVNKLLDINMKSCVRYNNVGVARLTGKKQIILFLNWLYSDSNIFLKRKFDKYQNYIIFTKK